jgi:hypothetical protein
MAAKIMAIMAGLMPYKNTGRCPYFIEISENPVISTGIIKQNPGND